MHFREHPIIQSYDNESLFYRIIAYLASVKTITRNNNSGRFLNDRMILYDFVTYLLIMFDNWNFSSRLHNIHLIIIYMNVRNDDEFMVFDEMSLVFLLMNQLNKYFQIKVLYF